MGKMRFLIKKTFLWFSDIILNFIGYLLFWIKPCEIIEEEVKSILLLKLERIGDLVLTTPAIREVRKRFPNACIKMVVNTYTKPIIENDPNINEVLIYDKKAGILGKVRFVQGLKQEKFDLAIDLGTRDLLFLSSFLIFLSRAKASIGLNNYE